jgi:DNA invertase Pin-like site-specific DNA recombinase
MNIVVGYVQSSGDLSRQADQVRALQSLGCQAVRVEAAEPPARLLKPVLEAVCDFLGPGDELVALDVTHLGSSPRAADAFLGRLLARGARVRLLDPGLADLELPAPVRAEPPAAVLSGRIDAGTVRALSAHGFGPTQIARKLGVSRMTVWRKLAAAS